MRYPTLALLALFVFSSSALAAVFTVTNTANTGPGSLRQAVIDANAAPSFDIIEFGPVFQTPQTITVTGAVSVTGSLTNALTIIGPGPDLLTISGNGTSQVFRNTSGGDLTLIGMTITQGRSAMGGAVYSSGSSLRMSDVRVTSSTATTDGGAIFVDLGDFNCTGCLISGNTATRNGGGVVFDSGSRGTISQTRIVDNQALSATTPEQTGGGGIFIFPTNGNAISIGNTTISGNSTPQGANGAGIFIGSGIGLQMFSTTISGNNAAGDGGAIAIGDANLNMTNTTLSGNTARNGGGIYRTAGSSFRLAGIASTTIANNTASADGGGYYGTAGNLGSFRSSIVADNTAAGSGPDLFGTVESLGHNLIETTAGYTFTGDLTGNIHGQDPLLGPLADNGGLVRTHALPFGSPAIDTNSAQTGTNVDARGRARQSDGDGNGSAVPDIGSFERHPGVLEFSAANYPVSESISGGNMIVTVTRTGGTDGDVSVQYSTTEGTAVSGSDYTHTSGTLTFANGVATQSFVVPIIDDTAPEPNETVALALMAPGLGGRLGTVATSTLTITSDDTMTISGRVTTPSGLALRNAIVSLIDASGVTRSVTTGPFGLYSFDSVRTGEAYTLRVLSKRYRFTPRAGEFDPSVTTIDFVGLE